MNSGYRKIFNKLNIKNTRSIKLKNSDDFLSITDGNRKYYGGDQNWFYWEDDKQKSEIAVYSGCGSVAVSNVLGYLSKNHKRYWHLKTYRTLQKDDYMDFMKYIYEYAQPLQISGVSFGVTSIAMMKSRLKKCADAYDIELSMKNAKVYNNFNYLVDFISTALRKDLPVMMLIGLNGNNMEVFYEDGRVTKGEFAYHWVTITELIIDDEKKEAVLRCSSWGKSAYISLRDFMKFEALFRGLIYVS